MSTGRQIDPETTAESLHAAAIHLLRKLRRLDGQPVNVASSKNQVRLDGQSRLSALSVIVFAGPITLGQLANAEQVRPPTMTRIVNALEANGLVKKTASAEDRRTIHLSATMRGKRLLLRARNHRVHSLAHQIQILPRHDQQTLHAAVAIIARLIRAL
jgi:DNA-binding MarR family transcriptional regulator